MTQEIFNRPPKRHTLTVRTLAALIVALVAALAVAAIVVSIGIARADGFTLIDAHGGLITATTVLLAIAGVSGLTATMVDGSRLTSRRE